MLVNMQRIFKGSVKVGSSLVQLHGLAREGAEIDGLYGRFFDGYRRGLQHLNVKNSNAMQSAQLYN